MTFVVPAATWALIEGRLMEPEKNVADIEGESATVICHVKEPLTEPAVPVTVTWYLPVYEI